MNTTLTVLPATHEEWTEAAAALTPDGRAVIDGERTDAETVAIASGPSSFASVNPATGERITDVSLCGSADVDRAVGSARRAFEAGGWSRASATDRRGILLRLADLIDENSAELALLDSLEMGKPVAESASVDVPGASATFRWYAEAIDKVTGEVPATPAGSTALVSREPLGVVAAIVPWNFPLEIAAWKLAPALAVGNSVVLKPAAESSLSALRLGELALQAGLPAGALNVVPGPGSTVGEALGLHPGIDALTFTGSTAVAKRLLTYSGASNMKRLSLEAGGKSSNLIFADADDLPLAATKAAFGAFYNQGEVCSANSRILVQRAVADEFLELFIEAARAYAPGDPLNPASGSGALVSEAAANRVMTAVEQGARDGTVLFGGNRVHVDGRGAFVEPTIIAGLAPAHPLEATEVFGPLATVTVFDDEDEAIRLANATDYGLAASLWTGNLARAHRVAGRLVAGTVSVNTVDALGLSTPFGGFRQSGFGRDLSIHALDNYVGLKTTWFQHG
ncbi:MAG TPA: aldehyde dehydrogenase [Diaminobutyricibacter sp.]